MIKSFLIITFALALAACASPVYETRYQFTLPETSLGQACAAQCESTKNQCNRQCQSDFAQCSTQAAQLALQSLPAAQSQHRLALQQWHQERARYRRDIRYYEQRRQELSQLSTTYMSLCEDDPSSDSCALQSTTQQSLERLRRPKTPDTPPAAPTIGELTAEQVERQCRSDCGCESSHRQCFAACGGAVTSTQVCVEHCEDH